MARPPSLQPKYCLHKSSGRAFVRLNGERVYLGRHGTQASRDMYSRVVGEWIARNRQTPPKPAKGTLPLMVLELADAFWQHARTYYTDADGKALPAVGSIQAALRFLNRLYGDTPAINLGPRSLKVVRQAMVDARPEPVKDEKPHGMRVKWSRQYINQQVGWLRRMFKWGAENELVPASIFQALLTVPGLRRGKTTAHDTEPVKPVADAHVDAVLPFVSRQVKAMLQLQRLTGARGGELCIMRTRDVDRSGKVWKYRPRRHKTEGHGHKRVISIGPRAQEILTPFLKLDPDAYVFSPAEAEAQRLEALHEARIAGGTPVGYGNGPGDNRRRNPKHAPGKRYNKNSYAKAIARACERAFPPPEDLARGRVLVPKRKRQTRAETDKEWKARLGPEKWEALKRWQDEHHFHPHQIRHSIATKLRASEGIDIAQTVLGHRLGSAVTEVYAEADQERADEVIAKIG